MSYALKVSDIPAVINACVSTAMLNQAAGSDVDDLLTGGKDQFTSAVMEQAQEKLQLANVGITLTTVELTHVAMPEEVREIYNQVTSASVTAATTLEKAQNVANTRVSNAKEQATTTIAEAKSDKAAKVASANSAQSEFWGLVEEYNRNPEVVRTRLYTQKVAEMMKKIGTVKIVEDGETNIVINP